VSLKNKIKKMKYKKEIIVWIVAITGLFNIFGWIFDIKFFQSVFDGWISMKPLTGSMFCLSALIMSCLLRKALDVTESIWLMLASVWTMAFTYLSIAGFSMALPSDKIYVSSSGTPSLVTAFLFGLLGCIGFYKHEKGVLIPKIKCWYVWFFVFGGIGLLGNVLRIPALTFYFKDVSSGMAVHTAALFVLIGYFLSDLRSIKSK
jgi:hypothetical protein